MAYYNASLWGQIINKLWEKQETPKINDTTHKIKQKKEIPPLNTQSAINYSKPFQFYQEFYPNVSQ